MSTDLTARYNALRAKRESLLEQRARAEQARDTAQENLTRILTEAGCSSLEELEQKAKAAVEAAEAALTAAEQAFA